MVDTDRLTSRAGMPAAERAARARLTQLLQQAGLLRGTLLMRERRCGKATCRCAKGAGHMALCLQVSRDGKNQQVLVPRAMETEVRTWVDNYRQVRERLEEVSDAYWARLAAAKATRRKARERQE